MLFIKRLGSVFCTLLVAIIPIGFILLSNYLYKLYELQGLSALQWVVSWILIIGWTLILGTVVTAILAWMISDLIKLFKWLFIDSFKNN